MKNKQPTIDKLEAYESAIDCLIGEYRVNIINDIDSILNSTSALIHVYECIGIKSDAIPFLTFPYIMLLREAINLCVSNDDYSLYEELVSVVDILHDKHPNVFTERGKDGNTSNK